MISAHWKSTFGNQLKMADGDDEQKINQDQVMVLSDQESRPISEASSIWDEAESRNEVKRRQQQQQNKVMRNIKVAK